MLVTVTSEITGQNNQMDLPITLQAFFAYEMGQATLQEAFPNLNADQREFIKTGITPEEWDQYIARKPA